MSVCYAEVGPWSIAVESDLPAVHDALALNFGRRYSVTGSLTARTLLTCRVVSDRRAYRSATQAVVLDGPEIRLSPGITIRYGFSPPKTWLKVTQTSLIELDASKPAECLVLLHPDAVSAYSGAARPDPEKRMACPEAFFYPMLAEWVRSFGACLVHCGAVALNGRAIFLTGPSGSGKSTHVLRMVARRASFVADDLALLHSGLGGVRLMRFRDVANLRPDTMEAFPELSHLRDAPIRGDGKHSISIEERFPQQAIPAAEPGVVLRLHAGDLPTIERVPAACVLDGMYSMAWFGSRPESNRAHFMILTDWLFQCPQWYVSRAYLRDRLDELMLRLGRALDAGDTV